MKFSKKVLYIDNDNEQSKIFKNALKDSLFSCICSESGESGLKNILKNTPDIVFVDDCLPDMKADLFIKRIKTQPEFKNLKDILYILMTSNHTINPSQLKKSGFHSYFNKPFQTSELISFINSILTTKYFSNNSKKIKPSTTNGKRFLESILESSVESIFTTDKKGYITYCNKACLKLFKYKFDEFVGINICELLNNGSTELLQILDTIKTDGKLTNYKTELIQKDKERIPVSLFLSQMKDIESNTIGYLALTMHQHEDLNKSSSQRSEKLATILETAITVNHAINNPLVPILGHAQFLLQDERIVDEDIRKRLNIIINNALRIKNITQKLTRISKPVSKEYIKGTKMLDLDASI